MNLEEALAKLATIEAEKEALATANAGLESMLSEKEAKIVDMTNHAREQNSNWKKFRDMSKEDKEALTEKEIELIQRNEAVEERAREIEEKQNSFLKDQRAAKVNELIKGYAKGDKDIADKIAFNLSKIKDSELAIHEDALAPLIKDSYNMLGSEVHDTLRAAHNATGATGVAPKEGNFTNTEEGKSLETLLFGSVAEIKP